MRPRGSASRHNRQFCESPVQLRVHPPALPTSYSSSDLADPAEQVLDRIRGWQYPFKAVGQTQRITGRLRPAPRVTTPQRLGADPPADWQDSPVVGGHAWDHGSHRPGSSYFARMRAAVRARPHSCCASCARGSAESVPARSRPRPQLCARPWRIDHNQQRALRVQTALD